MAKQHAPKNWRIEIQYGGDTGYGDGRVGYSAYRWESFTTGHLWWKKTRQGWVHKGHFDTRELAAEYANQTEQMLKAEEAKKWPSVFLATD